MYVVHKFIHIVLIQAHANIVNTVYTFFIDLSTKKPYTRGISLRNELIAFPDQLTLPKCYFRGPCFRR